MLARQAESEYECWSCGGTANADGEYCDDCATCKRCHGEGTIFVSDGVRSYGRDERCPDCSVISLACERLKRGFGEAIDNIKAWGL
jgi:hypothetical protein